MYTQLGETEIRKHFNGWQGETIFGDKETGLAVQINTWKGSKGGLQTRFQFGEYEECTNFGVCFSFVMFQDEGGVLATNDSKATEKSITALHTEGVRLFKQKFHNLFPITGLIASKFFIDDSPEIDGYHDNETFWNGWACPFFNEAGVKSIAQSMSVNTSYEFKDDTVVVKFLNGDTDEEPEVYHPQTIIHEGNVIKVWAIGSHYWCWSEVVPQEVN